MGAVQFLREALFKTILLFTNSILVDRAGFEPATFALRGRCSTN